jgi:hypothetical protein
MDEWDEEYLDLVETAHITIDRRCQGEFFFGAVKGWLDCRFTERDGLPFVEFSWERLSEGDNVCRRGWARLQPDESLEGHLFIHLSDDSAFVAKPRNLVSDDRGRLVVKKHERRLSLRPICSKNES